MQLALLENGPCHFSDFVIVDDPAIVGSAAATPWEATEAPTSIMPARHALAILFLIICLIVR